MKGDGAWAIAASPTVAAMARRINAAAFRRDPAPAVAPPATSGLHARCVGRRRRPCPQADGATSRVAVSTVARSVRRVREQLVRDGRDGVGREPVPDAAESDETSVRDLGGERLTVADREE